MDFAEYRSLSDAPENGKVVCSLSPYQMVMKGNVPLPFKAHYFLTWIRFSRKQDLF